MILARVFLTVRSSLADEQRGTEEPSQTQPSMIKTYLSQKEVVAVDCLFDWSTLRTKDDINLVNAYACCSFDP